MGGEMGMGEIMETEDMVGDQDLVVHAKQVKLEPEKHSASQLLESMDGELLMSTSHAVHSHVKPYFAYSLRRVKFEAGVKVIDCLLHTALLSQQYIHSNRSLFLQHAYNLQRQYQHILYGDVLYLDLQ
jgi:hypothetical protein